MTGRRLTLLLILLLAFVLRVHEIDAQSLWYDEGVTAQVARLGVGELARWTADDIQPPLYYLLVGGWLRFVPFGELTLRLPSAFFGLLLVPLLWALGRRLWDEGAGLLTALVATVSPLMVYYAQEARMYTLLLMWVSLAALAAVRWQVVRGRRAWAATFLYALAGLAAMYTHYFAGFALLALALYWLIMWWLNRRDGRGFVQWLLAHVLIGVGYLPWLPAMLHRFAVDRSYWSGTLKLGEALVDVGINFTTGATEVMLEKDAQVWLPWLGLATLLWMVAVGGGRRSRRQRPLLLLALWLFLPVAMILVLAYRTPKFNARYLMISWPAWALLAGGGINRLWQRRAHLPAAAAHLPGIARPLAFFSLMLVLVPATLGLRNWFYDDNFAKSAWREAITEMYRHRQEDEVALLVSGHAYPVFDTYLPPRFGVPRVRLPEMEILDVTQVLGWEETADALNRLAGQYGGLWLFRWQDEVADPAQVTRILLERWADSQPTPSFAYIGLDHYRFRPGVRFPSRPPFLLHGQDFADLLRLVGIEPTATGIWLYWQALAQNLPDLHVALRLRDARGQVLWQGDMRPVGYDFPTTRWQKGETYPVFIEVPEISRAARLSLQVYRAPGEQMVGQYELDVRVEG
ncbi:MAG: hypothetical protein D6775_04925 [Caldilineae bacterium]|nr:MAG: hypothetical protein D6775_04925 [Caldilineae bacterium]